MDLRKRKTVEAPPPMPSKSTKTKARSKSFVEPRQKITSPVQPQFYIGDRVAVDSMSVVGTLKFLGEADFKEGLWAGIQLDILGSGKNDGSVKGIRYFACPPQTGLFVLASKLTPLEQDSDSIRSLSPNKSSRAAQHIGLTGSQLSQQKIMIRTQPNTPITSPVSSSSHRQSHHVQSPTPTHYKGMPSPAMTPTHPDEEMLADMRMPAALISETPQEQHARELNEAIDQGPDKVQQLQLQLRVDVLEAENHYLKLENTQKKSFEKIVERSLLLQGGKTGQELFTLEGHQTIMDEIKAKHAEETQAWEQQKLTGRQTVQRLETRVLELEAEQMNLMTERDQSAYDISAMRKEKSVIERQLHELGNRVAEAEAAQAAAQAGERLLLEKTRALQMNTQQYFQPGIDHGSTDDRQMQLELEMEEVHEKMSSLRDAARAKDMFLASLSEQVEVHRNAVEEKEREIRKIKADAERHGREKDRALQQVKELEAKWSTQEDNGDQVKQEMEKLREAAQADSVRAQNYQERIKGLQEMIDELKRAGMESIELYESSVEKHRVDREALEISLADEQRKVTRLEREQEELHKTSREAVESFERKIADMTEERDRLVLEQNDKREALQMTIDSLKQEIEQLMNNAATEELKEVWEKERKRLTEQVMACTEAFEKQLLEHSRLQKESEGFKDQLKETEKIAKERTRMEEQVHRLQSDYEEQLAARSKYLEEVRLAVESQKKAESELRRMTEQKEKLERDLQDQALSQVSTPVDNEKHRWEIETFRSEIEKLQAQNAMLMKQKEQAEMNQNGSHQKLIDLLKQENRQLTEKQNKLEQTQKQSEDKCFKLTEEIGRLRQAEERKPTIIRLEGLGNDEKVKEISQLLQDTQKQLENLNASHTTELRKLKEKENSEEKEYKQHVASLNRDISELESLIESKIFKEADLEEALDKERKLARKLNIELQDLKDDMASNQRQDKEENSSYCEICEIYGHDLISCSKVVSVQEQPERPYCDNCEEHGLHSTDNCRNQNESF